jgi:VanZ family protein
MRLLKLWLPVVVWAALILVLSSDALSWRTTEGWLERPLSSPLAYLANIVVRKAGHIFEFSVLAWLAYRASGRFGVAMYVVLFVACLDETRQSFTATRTGSPWDVILDTSSAFLLLVWWTRRKARSSV